MTTYVGITITDSVKTSPKAGVKWEKLVGDGRRKMNLVTLGRGADGLFTTQWEASH